MSGCNCINQDCFPTISMPCCTGTPGATGPAGPAGATLLYNDMVESSIVATGAPTTFITAKEFLLPAAQLATNGDKIVITGLFETTLGYSSEVEVYTKINGQLCNAEHLLTKINNVLYLKTVTELSRKDVTGAANNIWFDSINYYATKNMLPYQSPTYVDGYLGQHLTVPYATAPGVMIAFEGYIHAPSVGGPPLPYLKCKQMTIEYYKI